MTSKRRTNPKDHIKTSYRYQNIDNDKLCSEIWKWFLNCSLPERTIIIKIISKYVVRLVSLMYLYKKNTTSNNNTCSFFFDVTDSHKNEKNQLESLNHTLHNFLYKNDALPKHHYPISSFINSTIPFCYKKSLHSEQILFIPQKCLDFDAKLINSVLFCSSDNISDECDTLTLDPELLSNTDLFYSVMFHCSRGSFLTKSYLLHHNSNSTTPNINNDRIDDLLHHNQFNSICNDYLKKGYYSLGTYLSFLIELALWTNYSYVIHNNNSYLHNANITIPNYISDFYNSLTNQSIDVWNNIFHIFYTNVKKQYFNSNTDEGKENCNFSTFVSKIETFSEFISVISINKLPNINSMYFTSIDNLGTISEKLYRTMGIALRNAYSTKTSKDLINTEDAELLAYNNENKGKKSKKKNKKKAKKNEKNRSITPNPGNTKKTSPVENNSRSKTPYSSVTTSSFAPLKPDLFEPEKNITNKDSGSNICDSVSNQTITSSDFTTTGVGFNDTKSDKHKDDITISVPKFQSSDNTKNIDVKSSNLNSRKILYENSVVPIPINSYRPPKYTSWNYSRVQKFIPSKSQAQSSYQPLNDPPTAPHHAPSISTGSFRRHNSIPNLANPNSNHTLDTKEPKNIDLDRNNSFSSGANVFNMYRDVPHANHINIPYKVNYPINPRQPYPPILPPPPFGYERHPVTLQMLRMPPPYIPTVAHDDAYVTGKVNQMNSNTTNANKKHHAEWLDLNGNYGPIRYPLYSLPASPLVDDIANPTWPYENISNFKLDDEFSSFEERCKAVSQDIKDFEKHVTSIARNNRPIHVTVIDQITKQIHSLWPQARIKIYGSFATNLQIPSSDIDIVILGVTNEIDMPGSASMVEAALASAASRLRAPLHMLAGELRKEKWLRSLHVISTAKIPVIKLVVQLDGLNVLVDITFEKDRSSNMVSLHYQHSGLTTAALVQQYLSSLPSLRPLVLVVKQYLFEHNLLEMYSGGIGSYCLFLLIVAYLQFRQEIDQSNISLGQLLFDMLQFYGLQFNFQTTIICPRLPHSNKSNHSDNTNIFIPCPPGSLAVGQLFIADPLKNTRINVAQGVWAMWSTKASFAFAFSLLNAPFAKSAATPTLLSRILRICVQPLDYDSFNSPDTNLNTSSDDIETSRMGTYPPVNRTKSLMI